MGRQAEMLANVLLPEGWRIDYVGDTFVWECSLPPRGSSYGPDHKWRLAGRRFGAPMDSQPDNGYSDDEVLCDALATFLTLSEHEVFEWFQAGGESYINPHRATPFNYRVRKSYWLTTLRDYVRGGGA